MKKALIILFGLFSTLLIVKAQDSKVIFYGGSVPYTLYLNDEQQNKEPSIKVEADVFSNKMYEVKFIWADTNVRAFNPYQMKFKAGHKTTYKLKKKSVPGQRPIHKLTFLEQEKIVKTPSNSTPVAPEPKMEKINIDAEKK